MASRQDIIRVHREVQAFIDTANQSIMRHDNPVKYPGISEHLRAIALQNQIDMRDMKQCGSLLTQLDEVKEKAPSVHISFPTEPTSEVLQRIVVWFRSEIDSHVVIQVGIQPTIAVGVIIRTPNQQFDFSLRQHLFDHQNKLKEAVNSVQ